MKEGRGAAAGGRDSPRMTAVPGGGGSGGKSKNGVMAGAGGSASGAGKRGSLPKIGFRAIAPAAVGAKAAAAAAANVPGMAAGLKRPKGVGGGAKGAFGRLNDSSREDRILEVSVRRKCGSWACSGEQMWCVRVCVQHVLSLFIDGFHFVPCYITSQI